MRPPPAFLPAADSKKWHGRRGWDSLGYFRVRTLANPQWQRQPGWLVRRMQAERPHGPGPERDLLDRAISKAKSYRALQQHGAETDEAFTARQDEQWDAILEPLDAYLEIRQRDHLRAVAEAGASGPQRPEIG